MFIECTNVIIDIIFYTARIELIKLGSYDFAEISKNLAKYISENNFVGLLKPGLEWFKSID